MDATKAKPRKPAIPQELRKEVVAHVRAIAQRYRGAFASDAGLKTRVLTLTRALLPPKPRRRGRPRNQQTTRAILLHSKLRRLYTSEKPREIWYRVAGKLIPDFDSYNKLEQRALVDDLRNRVKSRRRKYPARKARRISRL